MPVSNPTSNDEVIAAWASAAGEAANFGEEGDFGRKHLLNPTIFALLGDVTGRRILDAGCGQGYLSRMLARRGAIVSGVEPAEGWFHYSLARETVEPLGITYLQRDLSALTGLEHRFDAVV